jgi:phenylacetic acid degradation operon negative regulatory protein
VTAVPDTTARAGPRAAQPRHLIVTVYGLYSRAQGGWMSVASLVSLLADLGVDEPAVRSSISRLKRREILHARRRDGAAGYELSRTAQAILREGDHRIFRRERASLADGWLLAVFSVPEPERHQRHILRSQLALLGFGTAAPGVWIAPAYLHEATADMLERLGLARYADLFHADHLAFGDLHAKVRQWWDLDQTEHLAKDFVATYEPVLHSWSRRRPQSHPREAFADYVSVLTAWRRLPYLDPGLPAELLPPAWAGFQAADVFFTLQSRLAEPASQHATRTPSSE